MSMTVRSLIDQVALQEDINFLLTNRIPRRLRDALHGLVQQDRATRWSAICRSRIWRLFADPGPQLRRRRPQFRSLHDCFIRELKDGARPVDRDPGRASSARATPSSARRGAIAGDRADPGQGFPYTLAGSAGRSRAGRALPRRPLRHAAADVEHVPPLPRAARLHGRAGRPTSPATPGTSTRSRSSASRGCSARTSARSLQTRLHGTRPRSITLVPVAAILVASIRLHFLDVLLHLKYPGPNVIACEAPFRKGDEMGWFEHGSTIIVFAPPGLRLCRRRDRGRRHPDGAAAASAALIAHRRARSVRRPGSAGRAPPMPTPLRGGMGTASAAAPGPGGRGTPRGPRCSVRPAMLARASLARAAHRAPAGRQQIVVDRAVDALLERGRRGRARAPTRPAGPTPSPRGARCRTSRCATETRSSRRWRSAPPGRRRSDSRARRRRESARCSSSRDGPSPTTTLVPGSGSFRKSSRLFSTATRPT